MLRDVVKQSLVCGEANAVGVDHDVIDGLLDRVVQYVTELRMNSRFAAGKVAGLQGDLLPQRDDQLHACTVPAECGCRRDRLMRNTLDTKDCTTSSVQRARRRCAVHARCKVHNPADSLAEDQPRRFSGASLGRSTAIDRSKPRRCKRSLPARHVLGRSFENRLDFRGQ